MAIWYNKVIRDIGEIANCTLYFEDKIDSHRKDISISGSLEANLMALPGVTENVWSELQEIEAILEYMNICLRNIRSKYFRSYMETYNKALSSRDAEKYVDGEFDVVEYEQLINEVALIRNKYLGLMKGLESKGYQLNSITKIRCAGMENLTL